MLTALFGLMALSVLTQPNAPRLFAVLIFMAVTLSHDAIGGSMIGFWYYGSAALLDVGIIILTSGINPLPKMVVTLHRICMVSIAVNFFGWLMWYFYQPPTAYDSMFLVIYAWALMTFITRDTADVGGFKMDSWRSCIRGFTRSRGMGLDQHGGKV